MVRLLDLKPRWIDWENRRGLGVEFGCMVGSHNGWPCEERLMVLFANPLDGGEPWPGESRTLILKLITKEELRHRIVGCGPCRWKRTGETFETLTLRPSVNAYSCGHLTLTEGIFR